MVFFVNLQVKDNCLDLSISRLGCEEVWQGINEYTQNWEEQFSDWKKPCWLKSLQWTSSQDYNLNFYVISPDHPPISMW